MKTEILAAIGEDGLQPAASLNAALAANDRVKYAFSLLQMALAHGEELSALSPLSRCWISFSSLTASREYGSCWSTRSRRVTV